MLKFMVVVAAVGVVSKHMDGCSEVSDQRVQISKRDARDFLERGDRSVEAFDGNVKLDVKQAVASTDQQNHIEADFSLKAPKHTKKAIRRFLKGRIQGTDAAHFVSETSDDAAGKASVIVSFTKAGAGTACLSFTGKATGTGQQYTGRMKFLGGTGAAAKLHGSGAFRAIQPKGYDNHYLVALRIKPTLGAARAIPAGCGQPEAPTHATLTATTAGFAFADAGAKKTGLPAGTTVYPSGTPIQGAVGCGQSLFLVLDYQGPAGGKAEGYAYDAYSQDVKNGRNAVLLSAGPPNGELDVKLEVTAPGAAPVDDGPVADLERTC